MNNSKNILILFILVFGGILAIFASTESLRATSHLPETNLTYTEQNTNGVDTSRVYNRRALIELSTMMFSNQELVLPQTKQVAERQVPNLISVEELKRVDVESEYDIDDLYRGYSAFSNLIDSFDRNKTQKIHNDFISYIEALPTSQNSQQIGDYKKYGDLLKEVIYLGGYDAYLINKESEYPKIRTSKVFLNQAKSYSITLAEELNSYEHVMIDQDSDDQLEYSYVYDNGILELRIQLYEDDLDQLIYMTFLEMIENNTITSYKDFGDDKLMLIRTLK